MYLNATELMILLGFFLTSNYQDTRKVFGFDGFTIAYEVSRIAPLVKGLTKTSIRGYSL